AAVASLADQQSAWRPAELVRELAGATPTTVTAHAQDLTEFLQRLADQTTSTRCVEMSPPVPADTPRRRDGRPITEAGTDRALTTQAILDEEEGLVAWAERRQDPDLHPRKQPRPIQFADNLTP